MKPKNNYNFVVPMGKYIDFKNKKESVNFIVASTLNETTEIFKYNGLPSNIDYHIIETLFQTKGYGTFIEKDGEYYILDGELGGQQDENYRPTNVVVANPYLKFNKTLKIDDDCVVINNDSMYMGLLPMIERYASLLTDGYISFRLCLIQARVIPLISGNDNKSKNDAETYIKHIINGDESIVASNLFLETIKSLPIAQNGSGANKLTDIIESIQYVRASLFNDIGLNANYNMKRESLNSQESQMGEDALIPMIDNMLKCRKIAFDKINKKYGLNIQVELNDVWKKHQKKEIENNGNQDIETSDSTE